MRSQRAFEQTGGTDRPSEPTLVCAFDPAPTSSAGAPAWLVAAIEVLLDEMDSLGQLALRGDGERVPEVSLRLANGRTLRGVVIEHAAWQHAVVFQTTDDEVVRVSVREIASASVDLDPSAARSTRALGSGVVRVHR
jgi:hypothetical protein